MGWTTPRTWVASELVTASHLNTHVRDNMDFLYGALGSAVIKESDQSVTSSTTLQNDNELSHPIDAAGTYIIDLTLIVTSAANAAGDIRVGATFPAGTCTAFMDALDTSLASGVTGTLVRAASSVTSGVDPVLGFGASTSSTYAHLRFLLVATGTGTFQFQWAQSASNANATTVEAGSHMLVRQVA